MAAMVGMLGKPGFRAVRCREAVGVQDCLEGHLPGLQWEQTWQTNERKSFLVSFTCSNENEGELGARGELRGEASTTSRCLAANEYPRGPCVSE
jgi:hypothetical protein